MVMHSGQGAPLPADWPYEGQWVVDRIIFMYRPDNSQMLGGINPRFIASVTMDDGSVAVGFDASQIASWFETDVDTILASNSDGSLMLVETEDISASRGGSRAKRFVFQFRNRKKAFILEAPNKQANSKN
jgi:hypothetical protein